MSSAHPGEKPLNATGHRIDVDITKILKVKLNSGRELDNLQGIEKSIGEPNEI
jgi:hypothetical protein